MEAPNSGEGPIDISGKGVTDGSSQPHKSSHHRRSSATRNTAARSHGSPTTPNEALDRVRAALAEKLCPIAKRTSEQRWPSIWVPPPDTLSGPFTDGAL